MRNLNEIPSRCGECRFFKDNTCYHIGRDGQGHYGVTAYTPVCWDIISMQGGYTNEELWNDEIRDKRKYFGHD